MEVWRGTTAPERAAGRRVRLVEVAYELLGERGATGITVREVCSRAPLNPRYFYESFADLDALLVAVFDALVAEMTAQVTPAIEGAEETEAAKTRAAIDAAVRYLTDDPRRIDVLLTEPLGNAALAARRRELVRILAGQMADQAAGFFGIPRDARVLRSTTFMLAGGVVEMVIAWHNGTLALTVEELIEDASALISGTGAAAWTIARERQAAVRRNQR